MNKNKNTNFLFIFSFLVHRVLLDFCLGFPIWIVLPLHIEITWLESSQNLSKQFLMFYTGSQTTFILWPCFGFMTPPMDELLFLSSNQGLFCPIYEGCLLFKFFLYFQEPFYIICYWLFTSHTILLYFIFYLLWVNRNSKLLVKNGK